jgi:hypothetical protein
MSYKRNQTKQQTQKNIFIEDKDKEPEKPESEMTEKEKEKAKKKKEPMQQWGNPVISGAAAVGIGSLYTSFLRSQIRDAMRYAEQNAGRGAYSGDRFRGSGNQGGGGKSEYHNPHKGEMADKYDKFMAMKRMAAEGETEGLRSNAASAVEKWKKKYKFASMLKISKLLNY